MSKKSKASRSKKVAGNQAKKNLEKTQRERFLEAAREVGIDESGKEFEAALKKIIHHRG